MSVANATLGVLLRALNLPGFVRSWSDVAGQAEREGWGSERYLRTSRRSSSRSGGGGGSRGW